MGLFSLALSLLIVRLLFQLETGFWNLIWGANNISNWLIGLFVSIRESEGSTRAAGSDQQDGQGTGKMTLDYMLCCFLRIPRRLSSNTRVLAL